MKSVSQVPGMFVKLSPSNFQFKSWRLLFIKFSILEQFYLLIWIIFTDLVFQSLVGANEKKKPNTFSHLSVSEQDFLI